jgi:hypothetical protein
MDDPTQGGALPRRKPYAQAHRLRSAFALADSHRARIGGIVGDWSSDLNGPVNYATARTMRRSLQGQRQQVF